MATPVQYELVPLAEGETAPPNTVFLVPVDEAGTSPFTTVAPLQPGSML
jgi:hypothetical protein